MLSGHPPEIIRKHSRDRGTASLGSPRRPSSNASDLLVTGER
jgi:hypothetical protein